MPKKNLKRKAKSRQSKKKAGWAAKAWSSKTTRWTLFIVLGAAIVAGGTAGGLLLLRGSGQSARIPGGTIPISPAGLLSTEAGISPIGISATLGHQPYPLLASDAEGTLLFSSATLADNRAKYFTYIHEEQPIEFFLVKGSDSIIHAAFNACIFCYDSMRGYSQDGAMMVCNKCGREFPVTQINAGVGECSPIPLDRQRVQDDQSITVTDVIDGARYFLVTL